jgi:hypothetical protein
MSGLEKSPQISYTLYLSSLNKISGSANNADFNINWDTFLPRKWDYYKVRFTFLSKGGYFFDSISNSTNYSTGKIYADFGSNSFSYDTAKSGSSLVLGVIQRELQTTSTYIDTMSITNNTSATATVGATKETTKYSSAHYYKAKLDDNCPKTINRPSNNILNVKIYNTYGTESSLLVNTNDSGTAQSDFVNWDMQIEFTPIPPMENPNVDNRWS